MVACRQGAMLLNGGVDSSCGHAARAWSLERIERERVCMEKKRNGKLLVK